MKNKKVDVKHFVDVLVKCLKDPNKYNLGDKGEVIVKRIGNNIVRVTHHFFDEKNIPLYHYQDEYYSMIFYNDGAVDFNSDMWGDSKYEFYENLEDFVIDAEFPFEDELLEELRKR